LIPLQIAQIRTDDARKARRLRRSPTEAEFAGGVEVDHIVGRAIRIMEAKISRAQVKYEPRRYGLIEIESNGVAVNLLVPPASDRNRQSIRPRYLSSVLRGPVPGELRVRIEIVVDLHAWDLLKFLVRDSGVPVIYQLIIVRVGNQRLNLQRHWIQ